MNTPEDLEREHAALLQERAQLQKQCLDEWPIMSQQVARQRQNRLWAIRDRLHMIQCTKGFRQPGSGPGLPSDTGPEHSARAVVETT